MWVEDDRVRIDIGGQALTITESYEVSQRFLTQPSAFSVKIGSGATARELMARFPPGMEYRLYVNDVLQHCGRLDGYAPNDSSGATGLVLRGRDGLAPLIDGHIEDERSFSNASFVDLATACLDGAGVEEYKIFNSNEANRAAVSNTPGSAGRDRPVPGKITAATTIGGQERLADGAANAKALVAEKRAEASAVGRGRAAQVAALVRQGLVVREGVTVVQNFDIKRVGVVAPQKEKPLQAKVGQTWYGFLKEPYDRAGLFIIAGAEPGQYIITGPNPNQAPRYRLIRQRGLTRNAVNILSARHRNETTGRHARYVVQGRSGSGKGGRGRIRGELVDDEMVALGYTKVWAAEDDNAKTQSQAEYLARRRCAEARRAGWEYVATVAGHTAPALAKAGGLAVWAVDTVVEVFDDEYGIRGLLWIEGVGFKRDSGGTTTTLTLMRPEDLVFGDTPSVTQ